MRSYGAMMLAVGATAAIAQGHKGPATRVSPAGQYAVRGIDRTDNRLFVEDQVGHQLLESDDWGRTFTPKGMPAGVQSVAKVLRFRGRLYTLGRDTRSGRVGVYRALPTEGAQPLRWSRATLRLAPGSTALGSDFNRSSHYLYVGEYGDAKPAPHVYRSLDGVHWQMVLGPLRGVRHIHGVNADPYHPGEVWVTVGDGVHPIYLSRRWGARGSWTVAVDSSQWQSVQISFTRRRVYLAADTHSQTFFVVNRRTLRPRLGTPEYYARKHPPGSPADTRYLFNAFFGAVDPRTGIYYSVANDNSEGLGPEVKNPGTWQGMFAVRRVGGPVEIADPGGLAITMNGEVFIGGGRIWSGQWSIPALH